MPKGATATPAAGEIHTPALGDALDLALRHHRAGRLQEAESIYRQVLREQPDNVDALHLLGVIAHQTGRPDEAAGLMRQAVAVKPDYAEAHYHLGLALAAQGELREAAAAYRRSIELKPDNAHAHNNLGVALMGQGERTQAVAAFGKALALNPEYPEAHNNLGGALMSRGRLVAAVAAFGKALALKPDYPEAHNNLGIALKDQGRLDDAARAHRRAIAIEPGHAPAQAMLVETLQHMCDWQDLEPAARRLDDLVDSALGRNVKPGEPPGISVTRCEDASRNLAIAKSWSADIARRMAPLQDQVPSNFERSPRGKIRVGYLSADFHAHATSYLMVSLFGLHDREAFEIYAYSYGPDDSGDCRRRIVNGCESFVDIRDLSAVDAARRIHRDGVDILVDLKGYTKGTRLEICALRPAPVQATYLGFPGSTGAGFFDYILTDRIVTPQDQAPHYTEKFAFLPHCYQVNDHTQAISDKPFTRADFGLPDEGFVFCSFNQTYKIEAVMWEVWMRILRSVPGSVLWLYLSNGAAERNLKREAAARDVDPQRIVFATKLPKPEHLARLKLADLFLDTRICNGHTTASDALWAGVPLITLQGRHFASRVASSLLAAVGLPELITASLDGYEALALRLARNPDELAAIREKLAENRLTKPLFDTPRFARNLEAAYKEFWRLYLAGEAPRMVEVVDTAP